MSAHPMRLYAFGCLAILAASIVIGRRDLGRFTRPTAPIIVETIQPVWLPGVRPTPQSRRDRALRDPHFKEIGAFPVTRYTASPRIVHSRRGTVLVLDLNDSMVKEYTESGDCIRKYSAGRDGLPGKVVDFALGIDSTVWMSVANAEVLGVAPDGSVKYRLPELHADRLAWLHGSLLVATTPHASLPFGNRLFVEVSPTGQVGRRFGELLVQQARTGAALFGQLVVDFESGVFVFAPVRAGLLACYTGGGEQRYLVETVEPLPLPQLEITAAGTTRSPKRHRSARDVAIYRGSVFVLAATSTGHEEQAAGGSIVDVYALDTGAYRHSFSLPKLCAAITLWDNRVYASSGNRLRIWEASERL